MSSYQSNQIKLINTSLIDPHPDNPRKNIGDVTDLAASIKTNGLLTPLSVVPNGERYRVIAGHRRLAACKQAGIGAVPCFVLHLNPLQQLEAMVTENCQREQLTVLEEADAIQGMLALGATTANVAYRLGRSADYVRSRAKAASIKTEVRATRDDFGQLTIGQLVAIARYDGQPGRQKELAQAAGTSNFDYILRNIERADRDRQWIESVAALLVEPDNGINLIPDAEKEARRAAEQAERDARRHALEEYAAASADKRMAWLHANLHGIKRDKLIETTARLGLLQIIDPFPNGFTDALTSWNEHSGSRKEYEKISGIAAEDAPTAARISLQTADWPLEAVTILAARIEWFIDPTDWTTVNDTSRRIPGYYQILQDLGYTPADDETSHLDQLIAAISEADSDENEEDEENNQ